MADLYFSQQLSLYPPGYLESDAAPERFLETVERFEEDLTDVARIHRPMRVVLEVGEGIEVEVERDKSKSGDTLMGQVREKLEAMLARLAGEK